MTVPYIIKTRSIPMYNSEFCLPDFALVDYLCERGRSSVGRALRSQCRGRRFDPDRLHNKGEKLNLKEQSVGV